MNSKLIIGTTPNRVSSAFLELQEFLGTRVTNAEIIREHHGNGESYHAPALPDLVCFPISCEEISAIIRVSAKYNLPVVPFGAGTSLEGQVNAIRGGITISLRDMRKILRLSTDDMDVTVEAGLSRKQLVQALRDTGMTFFIDPGADCSIGGMVATRASGTTAIRYGTMRENVLGLTVVLADGRIIRTGTRARKSAAGYDLTHLFTGSEGTLGVIAEVILRLHSLPEAVSAATCSFQDMQGAVQTVMTVIQLGTSIARIELLDEIQMDAINRYSKTSYPVSPTLFFEFHGDNERHVTDQAESVQAIARENRGKGFQWAARLEDRELLWKVRHDAYYASIALRPGSKAMITDVCVPISCLAECIIESKKEHEGAPFPVTLVGHVGDGNFHMIYMLDTAQEVEMDAARRLSDSMVRRALRMGGTCTGEHGVGIGKLMYLKEEHGPALEVMRSLKKAFDPDNRMNPGKLVAV